MVWLSLFFCREWDYEGTHAMSHSLPHGHCDRQLSKCYQVKANTSQLPRGVHLVSRGKLRKLASINSVISYDPSFSLSIKNWQLSLTLDLMLWLSHIMILIIIQIYIFIGPHSHRHFDFKYLYIFINHYFTILNTMVRYKMINLIK